MTVRKRPQETFLNTVRKEKIKVNIYLINGIKLEGKVKFYDQFTILLRDGIREILVYKHAIATIVAKKPVDIVLDE